MLQGIHQRRRPRWKRHTADRIKNRLRAPNGANTTPCKSERTKASLSGRGSNWGHATDPRGLTMQRPRTNH
eukprot:150496-Rhodomonas_salina.3